MKLNWNFLGGGGCKAKKPSGGGGGGYGYILELDNVALPLPSISSIIFFSVRQIK